MAEAETMGLRIDVEDAKARIDAGDAVVLDVVQPVAWEQMNRAIEGAIRIPPQEIEDRFTELPRDRAIIAYCT